MREVPGFVRRPKGEEQEKDTHVWAPIVKMLGSGPESRAPKANQQLWGSDPRAITPTVWVLQPFCEKPVEAKLVMTHDTEKVKSIYCRKTRAYIPLLRGVSVTYRI